MLGTVPISDIWYLEYYNMSSKPPNRVDNYEDFHRAKDIDRLAVGKLKETQRTDFDAVLFFTCIINIVTW